MPAPGPASTRVGFWYDASVPRLLRTAPRDGGDASRRGKDRPDCARPGHGFDTAMDEPTGAVKVPIGPA